LKNTIIAILKVLIPLGVGVYLIWYYYDKMDALDRTRTFEAIQNADYFWLILSMILGLFSHLSRAYRWKYTLEPLGYHPKFWHLYHGVMIGYIVNLTIPRSGEASRAGFLYSTDGIPFSKSFGTIIAERAVDLIMLSIITVIAIFLQYSKLDEIKGLILGLKEEGGEEASTSSTGTYILIALGVLFVVGVVVIILKKNIRDKVIGILMGVLEGIRSIFKSKNPGGFILHTFIIWSLYVIMFIVAFKAIPGTAHMPLAGTLAAFIAGTVGLIFIPGGIGVYPALVASITTFYASYFIASTFMANKKCQLIT